MPTVVKRREKVLHILASLERGGIETWLMNVFRKWDWNVAQHDVCMIGTDKECAYQQEFLSLGGRVHCILLEQGLFGFLRSLRKFLLENPYDVIHSHAYFFSGFVLRCAKQAGVPVRIAHFHHTAPNLCSEPFIRILYRLCMTVLIRRYATVVLSCSKTAMQAFAGKQWQKDSRNRVLYYGIDLDKYGRDIDRAKLRAELSMPTDSKIVLHVGRFMPLKNHFFIVDVAEKICRTRNDIYFVLVGGGDEELKANVQKYVEQKKLTDKFRFCPPTSDLMPFWKSADLFLFPSLREGFPMVIIEACAAGLPIVASQIPSIIEASSICPVKKLLSLDSPVSNWADGVLELLEAQRLNQNEAIARVRSEGFEIHNCISSLLNIYEC